MINLPLLKSLTTSTMEVSACHNVSPSQNVDEDEMEDFVNAQTPQCPLLLPQSAKLDSAPNLVGKSMLDMVSRKLCALFHATQLYLGRSSETTTKLFDRMKEHQVNIEI